MKRHSLDLVVVVALFCMYTACALTLCVIGVFVYQNTADTMRSNYDDRTSVLYVAEKIHHNDIEGSVRIDTAYGADALVLIERESGRDYETWLFVQDGVLYEGLFAPGVVPDVELCQVILPMASMTVEEVVVGEAASAGGGAGVGGSSSADGRSSNASGQLLKISFLTVDGHTSSISLWLRSAQKPGV